MHTNEVNQTLFYQVRKQTYTVNGVESIVLQLVDVSSAKRSLSEKRLQEIINALVSHEMRNPLNAIAAMILSIKEQSNLMLNLIELPDFSWQTVSDQFLEAVKTIIHSCGVLDSGSKLLHFVVSDMLTLA